MKDVKQGDMVWVYRSWARRGEGPSLHEVVKVGRTLAHIDLNGRTVPFRLETGQINDGYGGSSFRTQAEQAEAERRIAAVAALREAGIEISNRHTPSLELLEALAEVAKAFGTEKEG